VGTRVTAHDLETDREQSVVIEDDFVVVVDGDRHISGVVKHSNGTSIVTIKKGRC
jgi:hypothetical protein